VRLPAMTGQRVADDFVDAAEIRRILVDAVGSAGAERADGEFVLPLGADHDDGRGIAARGEFAEHLQAVEVRHHQVEQQHIVTTARHGSEAVAAARGDVERPAGDVVREIDLHHLHDLRVVLGVKHTCHGWVVGGVYRRGGQGAEGARPT